MMFKSLKQFIVLWNFTEEEELDYLESLRPFSQNPSPLDQIEIENLHFQYDLKGPVRPRIFNDMITFVFLLKS